MSDQEESSSSAIRKEPHPKRLQRWNKINAILSGTYEQSLTGKEPHPKRKERWIKINKIIKRVSESDSYVTWNQIKYDFNQTNYVQPRRNMDDDQLDFLSQYLSMTTKCFQRILGHDTKRLYFIAPILNSVCILFDGEVDIVVEEDLDGNFLNISSHFEFMLRRGNKAVCINLAKKDNFDQAMIKIAIGCEVAAEVEGLDVVYGITTNYVHWCFVRSLDDKLEVDECSIGLTPEGPERESIKNIAERIYAMLSD